MIRGSVCSALAVLAVASSASAQAPAGPMGAHAADGMMQGCPMMESGMNHSAPASPDMGVHRRMGPDPMRLMLIMVDADGDGALSLEEVQAVHSRLFRAADADGNGSLSLEEIETFTGGPLGSFMHD
jgi:hypothetical protein